MRKCNGLADPPALQARMVYGGYGRYRSEGCVATGWLAFSLG